MPEGPEIRTAADQIAEALAGRVASEVYFAFDHLKPYEEELAGEIVTAVAARGKAMLIHFANDMTIYSHNQLYGQWLVRPAYDYPETNRQLRLAIHNQEKSALLYSASEIEVLRNGELDEHPYLQRLGLDPLNPAVTAEQIVARLKDERFRRRSLGALLLDQGFLAGVGNYLRSEILFAARLPPTLRPLECSDEALERLATAALRLARQSYETRGVTNKLQLVERLRQEGVPRREYRFQVFNRADRPCYVCGAPITRETVGGRRFYFCPSCQRPG